VSAALLLRANTSFFAEKKGPAFGMQNNRFWNALTMR